MERWKTLETYLLKNEPEGIDALKLAETNWGPSGFSIAFTAEEASEFLTLAGPYLSRDDVGIYGQCRLAITCGALLEGHPTKPVVIDEFGSHVGDLVLRATSLAYRLMSSEDPEGEKGVDPLAVHDKDSEAARAIVGLRYAILCAMTTLCRSVPARIALRSRGRSLFEFLELHGWDVPNGSYLEMLLQCTDEFDVLVVHQASGRVFDVSVTGVRNGFHFKSLLQHRLTTSVDPPFDVDGYEEGMVELMFARSWHQPSDSDYARWNYGTAHAFDPDGTQEFNIMDTVWGEPSLHWLPRVDDRPVVVLKPPTISRSWSNNFIAGLHEAHSVEIDVDELSTSEAKNWIDRLTEFVSSVRDSEE